MPWFSSWTCDLNTALLQREECPAALAGWEQGGLGNKWGKFNAGIHSGDAQVWCSGEEVLSLQSSKLFSLQIKWEGVFLVRCLHVWFGFNVDFYIKKNQFYSNWKARCVCSLFSGAQSLLLLLPDCGWISHTSGCVTEQPRDRCVSSPGERPLLN